MTPNNRIYLIAFISLVWSLVIYLLIEADTIIFNNQPSEDDSIESSGTMLFNGMED